MPDRRIVFDKQERARLAKICQVLGTTFAEFVHDAAMQAVDEFEGITRDVVRQASG